MKPLNSSPSSSLVLFASSFILLGLQGFRALSSVPSSSTLVHAWTISRTPQRQYTLFPRTCANAFRSTSRICPHHPPLKAKTNQGDDEIDSDHHARHSSTKDEAISHHDVENDESLQISHNRNQQSQNHHNQATESEDELASSSNEISTQHQQQHNTISTTATVASVDNLIKEEEVNRTAHYEKQYRVRQARAKIDSLLQSPEAPIDLEQELQRVKSIAPLNLEHHNQNQQQRYTAAARNDKVRQVRWNQLEQELHKATLAQDFDKASSAKEEMGKLHVEDCGAILQVNAKYYQAFSQKNIETMQQVWFWNDNTATCIHPSQKPLVGSAAVLESWKKMFQVKAGAFQKSWMEPHQIRLRMVGGGHVAIVTCDEHVYARRFVRGKRRTTELVNKLTATNVFRKDSTSGRWFMTYHHASWHADSDAAKQALNGPLRRTGGSSSDGTKGLLRERLMGHEQQQGEMADDDAATADYYDHLDDDEADAARAMDNIMGIPNYGPLLGDGKPKDQQQNPQDETSMIMGSLSDIINGGLGGSGENNPLGMAGSGRKAIIRVSRIDPNTGEIVSSGPNGLGDDEDANRILDDFMQSYDEEDDESDEDIDDDEDDDEEDDEYVTLPTPPKALRPKARIVRRPSASSDNNSKQSKKEAARKNQQACIAALRKLSEMGAISPRQKVVLINDIIRSSASSALATSSPVHGKSGGSKMSLVEIAYQLLVAPTEDDEMDAYTTQHADNGSEEDATQHHAASQEKDFIKNMALEEFADQCRIIAADLSALSSSEHSP